MERLRRFLSSISEGSLNADQVSHLIPLLRNVWGEINNNDTTGLDARRLDRIVNVRWHSPNLTFEIERHGQTMLGSTMADVHTWEVNTEEAGANLVGSRVRRVMAQDEPFKPVLVVQELKDSIVKGRKDFRLEYKNAQKTLVKILVGKVVTASNKQTLVGRRKRFRAEMQKQMAEIGWKEKSVHLYERADS